MNAFQICQNTSDLIPFYLPQQLFLKPIARINISLQLPNVKKLGKSVSHWEIMDKIRTLIRPDEFTVLKVTKTTIEFIRFEAEIETKDKLHRVLSKIDNKMIKLKEFSELMRLKAAEWKSDFPHSRVWDDYFQNARDMDEMKPGQRPDTVHISNVPSKWFIPYHLSGEEDITPSEKIFYRAFEKFGTIRHVDIPICDPHRKKMKDPISGLKNSSFDNKEFFEGYVQFKDYIGFKRAMDTLRNMKLVHKEDDATIEVNIKVDFDKSKHLSDGSIRRREIVRDRLVAKAREQEEKDRLALEEKKRREELDRQRDVDLKEQKNMRRKLREEKRKAKILQKLEITGSDEINEKIAKEEKKLLGVQRKLEAIRLVEELFRRIQEKNSHNIQLYDHVSNPSHDELKRFKNSSELEVLSQRQKVHNALKGRVMLKTILGETSRERRYSSTSSDSDISFDIPVHPSGERPKSPVFNKYPELMYDSTWMGFPHYMPPAPMFPETFHPLGGFIPRGRGFPRLPNIPGPSRGGYSRRRAGFRYRGGHRGAGHYQQYPTDLDQEYQKYFNRFLNNHDDRLRQSYSPGRRNRNRSRSRSRSRRSYSRSYTRSRSRTRSRTRSRSRRSRSYTYRSRTRSRSKSTRRQSRGRSRSKERRNKSRSKEKRSHSRSKERSHSRSKERRSNSRTKERGSNSRSKEKRSRSREKRRGSKENRSRSRSRYKDRIRNRSSEHSHSKKENSKTPSNAKVYKTGETEDRSSKEKRHSREKSVDSSTFIPRKKFLENRSRSKSWSLPREDNKDGSWSKSPEKKD